MDDGGGKFELGAVQVWGSGLNFIKHADSVEYVRRSIRGEKEVS